MNDFLLGSDFMEKSMAKIINFEEYREKKTKSDTNRKELLQLIKRIITTK
ncbi:hypothetical protein [Romboutsia sp.]